MTHDAVDAHLIGGTSLPHPEPTQAAPGCAWREFPAAAILPLMQSFRWLMFGLSGAFAAAVVNVLMKRSMEKLDATTAITIQSAVSLVTILTLGAVTGSLKLPSSAMRNPLALAGLAGVAAGFAWFLGYRALQLAPLAKATSIDRLSLVMAVLLSVLFLGERPLLTTWFGVALMVGGGVLVSIGRVK